jgi:cation-transporting ATPase 13A3/4/5
MALVSVIGFLSLLPQLLSQGIDTSKIVDKSLDLITIAVPPALPATMSVGVSFAIQRLRKS